MATLAFTVQADYDKVRRLSEELARLKTELRAVEENGTPEAVAKLERQISSCRAEMKDAVKAAADLGASMEESVRQGDFSTVDGQIAALTIAIHENGQAIGQTEQRVAELKTQYEQALSAGDTQAVEAITREVREQVSQFIQLTQQTEEYRQALSGLTEGGIDTSLEGVRKKYTEVGLAATAEAEAITRLKEEYQQLQTQLVMHVQQGTQEHKDILQRMQAIDGEITTRRSLLNELKEQDAALEESIAHMEQEGAEVQKASEQHASLRAQIRLLKEQMADMRANGIDEQSEAYRKLALELGRLQDIQGDIQRQGSVLANDERQFAGITSGLQGMTGGFYAVSGAMAMFGTQNQKLQAVLSKTHALMAVVNSLQQVAVMLNKDSAFRLVTLANAREWWNKVLEAGRGTQVADTAATQANTVAKQANTAAQTGNAAATGANTAAQTAQTGAAVAGTAANIGLAGAFRMVGAAIKSIPVFGWIAAAIGAIVAVTATFIKRANEAKKQAQEFYKALADEVYKPVGAVRQLANEWEKLGDSLEAKQKFIEQNRERFDALGVAIRGADDAENLLRNNADAFVKAQLAKAKATVLLQQAMEKTRDLAELQLEIDAMPDTVRTRNGGATTTYYTEEKNPTKERARERAKQLDADIKDLWDKVAEYNEQYDETLSNAGLSATVKAVEGSANDIKKRIASLQEDLDNNYKVGTDEYNRRKKQIEDLQSLLNDGNGRSGRTARVADNSEKEARERERAQEQLNKDMLSLERQNQQAEIDLMDEGTEKKLAQIEHSYKLQIAKTEELAKEMAEANAKAGVAGTNENGLSQEQQEEVDRATQKAKEARIKAEQAVYEAEKDAMYKFLREYGTYEQQRLAITEQYAKKIADASNVYERMSLTNQRNAELQALDLKFSDKKDWGAIFSRIDQYSNDYLQKLKGQLETMLQSDEVTVEQAKIIGDRIAQIEKTLIDRTTSWRDLLGMGNEELRKTQKLQSDLNNLYEQRNRAEEEQNKLLADMDTLRQAIVDYAEAEVNVKLVVDDVDLATASDVLEQMQDAGATSEQTRNVSDMFTQWANLQNQSQQLGNTIQGLDTGIEGTEDALGALGEGAGGAAGAIAIIDKIIHTVNQSVQSMVELLDQLDLGDTKFAEGWKDFAESSEYATKGWESLKSGDLIGVASGVVGSLSSLGNAIGKWSGSSLFGESDVDLHKDIERLTISNNDLANAIDGLTDKISGSTTSLADALTEYEQATANIEQMEANTQEMMQRSAAAYSNGFLGIGGSHSSNNKVNNAMTSADWQRISDIVGVSITSAKEFWTLSSKQMYEVSVQATDLYSKIKQYADDGYEDAAQYMDDYIEYWKEAEEVLNAYNEKITQVSFDSLVDSFKSAVMDMEHTAADFADDFEELMKNAVVSAVISDTYASELENWYTEFVDKMQSGGNLDRMEQEALREEYMDIVERAQDEIRALYDTLGWSTASTAGQTASSGTFQTMSEDTGQELSGRFTAMYEAMLRCEGEAQAQTSELSDLGDDMERALALVMEMQDIAGDTRSILANSYLELQEIRDNAVTSAGYLRSIQRDMAEVRANTSRL